MSDSAHLLLHNIVSFASAAGLGCLIIFLIWNGIRKTVNATLALSALAFMTFLISHALGVSTHDPVLSREILMWNLSVIWICVFNFHCVMAALHQEKEKRASIWLVYAIGAIMTAVFLFFPDTFILESVPKMYFPNYYVPGSLHWLMRLIFQIIIPIYFVAALASAYRKTADPIERNRVIYFAFALSMGWLFGAIPPLLIFDIPVDPTYGVGSAFFFLILFAYAVFKYELLDIRVIAKKAFLYAVAVTAVGFMIAAFNFSNQLIQDLYPGFPAWVTPLLSAVVVVAGSVLIWRQLRQDALLKYEFITTVTHKFRTPLTHIKWATENLKSAGDPREAIEQIGYIESANAKLVELTDTLANASETDENVYQYKLVKNDLSALVESIADAAADQANGKKILLVKQIAPGISAPFDADRLKFVVQTLIENAVSYTPDGGTITVSVAAHGKRATCSVRDTGIGISYDELPFVFSKLYRGKRARSIDTEGMGIGLFISKGILSRQRGKIWAESEGAGRGSVFGFSLPLAK